MIMSQTHVLFDKYRKTLSGKVEQGTADAKLSNESLSWALQMQLHYPSTAREDI